MYMYVCVHVYMYICMYGCHTMHVTCCTCKYMFLLRPCPLCRPPPAVQSIAQFTVHALSGKSPLVSHEVATAWLFVCRQLYNTAEGLHVLLPYSIHMHIANCLNKVMGGSTTCTCMGYVHKHMYMYIYM